MEIEYSIGNTIGEFNYARVITHIKINGEDILIMFSNSNHPNYG